MHYLTIDNILLTGSVLLFVSILVSKAGSRYGIPALLLFLLVGIGFGSDGLGVQFENVNQAQNIGKVALAIILFSGGMDTRLSDIRPVWRQGVVLSTLGVLLTTLITGFFIWWISGWGWTNIHFPLAVSLLLAATMSSTDSASVFGILKQQKINLKYGLRPMLELESGSNDPMAYMLTIVLVNVAASAQTGIQWWIILWEFFVQFAVGGLSGYLFGRLSAWLTKKVHISNKELYPIMVLSGVFFTFAFTELLGGNGYLAVYIAGLMVGNSQLERSHEITRFMGVLTWLAQIVMFLCLGLLVNPHEMLDVAVISVVIGIFMMLVARPFSVFVCLLPFKRKLSWRARGFVSWVGLRGAVPIIFATYPVVAGVEGAGQIFNIVFFITLLSLVVQGGSVSILARKLGLSMPLDDTPEHFGVELPEELEAVLEEKTLTEENIADADTLSTMSIPEGMLVIMIRRGTDYLVPDGKLVLQAGDTLLFLMQKKTNG